MHMVKFICKINPTSAVQIIFVACGVCVKCFSLKKMFDLQLNNQNQYHQLLNSKLSRINISKNQVNSKFCKWGLSYSSIE